MQRILGILLQPVLGIVVIAALGPVDAEAQLTPTDTVWVNLRSRVYHCRGTEYYGRTRAGEYMVEAAARSRGFRANGGRACAPRLSTSGDSVAATLTKGDEFGPTAPVGPVMACTLTRIIDGDTVSCDPVGDVRLIGIDAPERNQPTPYERSTAALTAFVPIGEAIELESDVEARDRYGRRLAHLWYKGRLVNWLMVRNGWAASYYYAPSIRYAAPLDSAESWARAERRGMWPDGGLPCRADPRRGKRC